MRHGSLFSGIGGFDLAAEWMGWENIFHCEWNEFGQKILKYYWPKAISYADIKKTDFTIHRGNIDILTGGFPCQPYSGAGKRKGTEDDRHLWPEMLRAIREIQPGYIVGENVRGLTNWNGGLVFDQVQAEMESEGYEVLPFLLPACAVNAPHRRDRIWFVAFKDTNKDGRGGIIRKEKPSIRKFGDTCTRDNERICSNNSEAGDASVTSGIGCDHGSNNRQERHISEHEGTSPESKSKRNGRKCRTGKVGEIVTNTNSQQRCEGRMHKTEREATKRHAGSFDTRNGRGAWEKFPTQSPVCNGDDGLSGKLDGITFSKWRTESVKGGGNAIVPQVAYEIFKAINSMEAAGCCPL